MKTFQIKTITSIISTYKIEAESKEDAFKAFKNREATRVGTEAIKERVTNVAIISTNELQETDVHTEHCCLSCGCKYGDESCSVASGKKMQSYAHDKMCIW